MTALGRPRSLSPSVLAGNGPTAQRAMPPSFRFTPRMADKGSSTTMFGAGSDRMPTRSSAGTMMVRDRVDRKPRPRAARRGTAARAAVAVRAVLPVAPKFA